MSDIGIDLDDPSRRQELQDIWDRAVIRAWKQDKQMIILLKRAMAEGKLLGFIRPDADPETQAIDMVRLGLRAVPSFQLFMRVRVWMATGLQRANNALWDGLPEERVLERMRSEKVRKHPYNEEGYQRQQHKRHTQTRRRVNVSPQNRSSQWGTTKGVRSK